VAVPAVVVLDFETSGLSPAQGDRAIEIGAVLLRGGEVVDQFQSLMNPGFRVSGFIENYTGISNAMLAKAPPCAEVMARFAGFIRDLPLVAHNASFDGRFLAAELQRIGAAPPGRFACTMLNARRIFPGAPNHRLETLVDYLRLPRPEAFHRALADARMAGAVWLRTEAEITARYRIDPVPFEWMRRLGSVPKHRVEAFFQPGPA